MKEKEKNLSQSSQRKNKEMHKRWKKFLDTTVVESEAVELSEEEKKIIDERLAAYHRNPDSGSPWKDVFQRIVAKR